MKTKILLICLIVCTMTLVPFTSLTVKADDPADQFTDELYTGEDDGALDDGPDAYDGLEDDSQDPADASSEETDAAAAAEDVDPCDSPANLTSEQKLQCLFPNEQNLIELSPQGEKNSTSLPSGDLMTDFLPFFINTALAITGTAIFIALLYGGYLFVMTNDNEEAINQGKKIMIYSVIGAIVVAISYAAVYGIANLKLD